MLTANRGWVRKSRTYACTKVPRKKINMLWTIAIVLLVLWALGLVTSFTLGGFIHILLFVAIVLVVMQLFHGRRVA